MEPNYCDPSQGPFPLPLDAESEFYSRVARHLTKRQQGYVMGAFRTVQELIAKHGRIKLPQGAGKAGFSNASIKAPYAGKPHIVLRLDWWRVSPQPKDPGSRTRLR